MQIKQFRNDDFINRESEIEFFLDYFQKNPRRILWVYGPKSTGKTTLIEYVIEEKLTSGLKIFDKYWIKYINFRENIISNYDSFIYSFFKEVDDSENDDFSGEIEGEINLGLIRIKSSLLAQFKQRKTNMFNELVQKFKKIKKKKIIIIDEIQALQDIYMNGERLLIHEFLNFCVRLTKELHLVHIVILTSNTIFLNTIYQNSKLKKTSEFKLVDHLEYNDIEYWLTNNYQLSIFNCQLIYDYLGGSVSDIKKLLDNYRYHSSIKEYLEKEVRIAKNEIKVLFELRKLTKVQIEKFYFIMDKIIKQGYFDNGEFSGYLDIISIFCEVEILFFDPLENKTTANSKIYEKAFERLIDN